MIIWKIVGKEMCLILYNLIDLNEHKLFFQIFLNVIVYMQPILLLFALLIA